MKVLFATHQCFALLLCFRACAKHMAEIPKGFWHGVLFVPFWLATLLGWLTARNAVSWQVRKGIYFYLNLNHLAPSTRSICSMEANGYSRRGEQCPSSLGSPFSMYHSTSRKFFFFFKCSNQNLLSSFVVVVVAVVLSLLLLLLLLSEACFPRCWQYYIVTAHSKWDTL